MATEANKNEKTEKCIWTSTPPPHFKMNHAWGLRYSRCAREWNGILVISGHGAGEMKDPLSLTKE